VAYISFHYVEERLPNSMLLVNDKRL